MLLFSRRLPPHESPCAASAQQWPNKSALTLCCGREGVLAQILRGAWWCSWGNVSHIHQHSICRLKSKCFMLQLLLRAGVLLVWVTPCFGCVLCLALFHCNASSFLLACQLQRVVPMRCAVCTSWFAVLHLTPCLSTSTFLYSFPFPLSTIHILLLLLHSGST